MASITYNPGINSVNPTVTLTVTQTSQSVANNTSTVNYSLVINRPSAISSNASKSFSITINGSTVKSGTTTIGGSGSKTIASGTTTISHNADGTKSINFSFSLTMNISRNGRYIGTASKRNSSITRFCIIEPTINLSSIPCCISIKRQNIAICHILNGR